MQRFEHSIAQLTQSLTTSNGWLEIAKSRLSISINDIEKWQGFVDKYQAEINDMESAIEHLKELSDNDMHLAKHESGEIVRIPRGHNPSAMSPE